MRGSPARVTTRAVAVTAVAAAAVTALAVPSLSAQRAASTRTPTTTNPAAAAAGYLARRLQGAKHDHYSTTYQGTAYPNYGETADAVLSMDAAGVAQRAAKRATSYLVRHVKDYAAATPTYYPGSLAKLILVAGAQHKNVHNFGGVDLVAKLAQTEGAGGAAPGEFQQNPGFSGSSYVVSQALPVLALAIAPNSPNQPDAAAVDFLSGQQCADGGYQSTIRDDTSVACSGEDVDSAGYAAQALLAAGRKATASKALTWLQHARNSDGGYGSPSNGNSTALAAQALIAGRLRAGSALRWLRSHQLGCGAARSRHGAVTFHRKYDASALLATSQAGAALAHKPLAWIDGSGAGAATPVLACGTRG